jgi:hypothetical protein
MASSTKASKSDGDGKPGPPLDVPDRQWVAKGFTLLEDLVYIGLSVLLGGIAVVLVVTTAVSFVRTIIAGAMAGNAVALLDQILLILILVEVLYTIQVSFREHTLVPEPFLIVALIAAIRRVLVLTAELQQLLQGDPSLFRNALLELGLMTMLILALVASLLMLRRRAPSAVADRA